MTRSGITCQAWNTDTPHNRKSANDNITPESYPDDGLESNYCRNTGALPEDTIWCFTMDPSKRWELCDPLTNQKGYGIIPFKNVLTEAGESDLLIDGASGREFIPKCHYSGKKLNSYNEGSIRIIKDQMDQEQTAKTDAHYYKPAKSNIQ